MNNESHIISSLKKISTLINLNFLHNYQTINTKLKKYSSCAILLLDSGGLYEDKKHFSKEL